MDIKSLYIPGGAYTSASFICRDRYTANVIEEAVGARGVYSDNVLTFENHNALDCLDVLGCDPDKYEYLTSVLPTDKALEFTYKKLSSDAVAPFKARASDSGYDLTLLKLLKYSGNTFWYSTGISVEPPMGYYFDLVPRSSLSKTGYILANSVGVIDRSYTGDIVVVLTKLDGAVPDLTLPFRGVQIIPRHIVHMKPVESRSLTETSRADGGFGSTG